MGQKISVHYSISLDHDGTRTREIGQLVADPDKMMAFGPLTSRFTRIPADSEKHSFSPHDCARDDGAIIATIAAFEMTESVPILPWLGLFLPVTSQVYFRSTDEGITTYVRPPMGIEFEVRWFVKPDRLYEEATMSGRSLLVTFSKKRAQAAHQNMMKEILKTAGARPMADPRLIEGDVPGRS